MAAAEAARRNAHWTSENLISVGDSAPRPSEDVAAALGCGHRAENPMLYSVRVVRQPRAPRPVRRIPCAAWSRLHVTLATITSGFTLGDMEVRRECADDVSVVTSTRQLTAT